ncbi:hypothetical protein GF386_05420 [Candidatus Pacearchaeota archaeon]|nr:hypothetical protein [Candidatus Pacearchaeota archaeon]MBD3283530.1 hypothetical protein [Candidatus Pacearchaeota archaeon]
MGKFEGDESAFNFGIEYLKDISNSLKACKIMAFKQDVDGWINCLRTVYRELSVKTKKEEDDLIENDFKEIYELLNNTETKNREKQKILVLEDKLEIKLRKKLQEKGMALPSKSDPRFAVLQR